MTFDFEPPPAQPSGKPIRLRGGGSCVASGAESDPRALLPLLALILGGGALAALTRRRA